MSESAIQDLPPGAYRKHGQLFRKVTRGRDGGPIEVERPVYLTREEAEARRGDWYHWGLGIWCIDGYKLESDRDAESIFKDDSESRPDPNIMALTEQRGL